MLHRVAFLSGLAIAVALPAVAETGIGLVIANRDYSAAPDARRADAVLQAVPDLEDAGFVIVSGADRTAEQMRDAFATFLQGGEPFGTSRIVIVLSGNFAHSGEDAWLLGRDAASPGLARADAEGLRLGPILGLAATAPGGALVVLAPNDRPIAPGARLSSGLPADIHVPQGVTLVRGNADQAAAFLRDVAAGGAPLVSLIEDYRLLRIDGFVSPFADFLPDDAAQGGPLPQPVPEDDAAERALWRAAQEAGTRAAYEAYLERYPDGRFAPEAQAEIDRIDALPENREAALNLTREERREIQRQLTLLGFSTRGIDGIFGPGTRTAIRSWQQGRRLPVTGYIDADQKALLAADAARRQAEIDEQERQQQIEQERADRAFWVDSGASAGDEAGLRAYLARYPRGLFADVARARLAAIEAEQEREQARRDRDAWDAAVAVDTVRAYRRYLANFPNGRYVTQARARIAELTAPDDLPVPVPEPQPEPQPDFPDPVTADPATEAQIAAARDEEASLALNFIVRNLVEAQLEALQFNPGRVDGIFDADFRRALRVYQEVRGIPVTGYVTLALLRQLIADGLPIQVE
jgi:peptidoglycan hydrolase-like protein with peptidoglycan-binding domain